jgi:hypothetical protein
MHCVDRIQLPLPASHLINNILSFEKLTCWTFQLAGFITATRSLSLSTAAILFIVFLFHGHSSALLLSSPLPSYPPQTQDIAIHEAGD